MTKLRILQVVPTFSPFFGGAVSVVRDISQELAKTNDVSVYTTTRYDHDSDLTPKDEWVNGYHVFYFKRNLCVGFLGELNISLDMMKAVQRNIGDFDVIHLHSWRQFEDYIILKYASKKSVPYVMHAHGTLVKTNKRIIKQLYELFWGKRLLRNASRVIAISPTEAQQFSRLGVPNNKIEIVYNGLNLNRYSKLPSYGTFRKRHGVDGKTKIILYLGRIDPTKGIDFLVESFAYAIKTLNLNDVKLVICGPDFGFLTKAHALVEQHGLSDKVLFNGLLSEAEKMCAYIDADIVVYPEEFNVWALVVMEAAACGKPVIVSETNHIASIVKMGKFGFAVQYGDVNSFARLIKDVISDEESLQSKGLAGKQFVHEFFSWKSSILKLERIYLEVAFNRV